MLNVILACDNEDATLGTFFESCSRHVCSIVNSNSSLSLQKLTSRHIQNDIVISQKIDGISPCSFVFISFSHGSSSELLKDGQFPFVAIDLNHHKFKNSVMYCYACKSGKKLGLEVVKSGCKAFVGFDSEVKVYIYDHKPFYDCGVKFIRAFCAGNNIRMSVKAVKAKHNYYIDKTYEKNMFLASIMRHNRDAFMACGNLDITVDDLL